VSQIAVDGSGNVLASTTRGGTIGTTGMWTFLAIDAIGFGGLLIAYGVLRARAAFGEWPDPHTRLELAPAAVMTFVLVTSSLTMTLATRAATLGRRRGWLMVTALLGAAFLAGAAFEYTHLADVEGMGLSSDLFASTFYVITGFHALHVLAGVVGVVFMSRAKFAAQAVETMGLYWHFVDVAWMPIFSILYLWPTA